MSGMMDLDRLLVSMSASLSEDEYVFCSVHGEIIDYLYLSPLATFNEPEGLSLILPKSEAIGAQLHFSSRFKMITLMVHSSLDAVGLTAAVAAKLAEHDISANVVAAYYHDHIFVPVDKATMAMDALNELTRL